MKKIIILAIFCSFLFISKGYSQQAGYWSMQYGMGFGTGDLGEYIEQASFRGGLIEYRGAINDNLLVGVDVGWNVFYEKKDKETYSRGTASLTGVQFRYQNEVPLLASIDYMISSDKPLKPYIGLGIGTIYTERSTNMNLYSLYETTWHFAVKPELGLLYEISPAVSLKLGAKYYYGFKTESLDSQGYISVSTGLAFSLN